MKTSLSAALAVALWWTAMGLPAGADEKESDPAISDPAASDPNAPDPKAPGHGYPIGALSSAPEDPGNLVPGIQERLGQKDALFPASPLRGLHQLTDRGNSALYDAIGLKLALAYTQVFMGLSESLPGTDRWGTNSNTDFLANWDVLHRGEPSQGHLSLHVQGRWDWGTTAPETLAEVSLGSLLGTANSFAPYTPAFLIRNLYWEQGSKEAGWAYRIGKITPDAILGTSAHMANVLTFMPTANFNFSIAVPDSGLGATGVWYPHERIRVLGLVSDSNANRYDWGHLTEGDFFKAIEFGVQLAPRTEKAGYSKLVVWHNDGTRDGSASNGNLGPGGSGFLVKLEQELTADGRAIGILRYGQSFNESAFYERQAGAYFLLYDPHFIGRIRNDLVGVGFNWTQATDPAARSEYDFEIFYRFPFFPGVDTTFSYQGLINPALDPTNSFASVFGFRIRTVF